MSEHSSIRTLCNRYNILQDPNLFQIAQSTHLFANALGIVAVISFVVKVTEPRSVLISPPLDSKRLAANDLWDARLAADV